MKFKYNSISIIAPHPDDEVLGCGGLISKLSKFKDIKINIMIVSGHLPPLYTNEEFEITKKECLLAHKKMGIKGIPVFLKIPATKINDFPTASLNNKIKKFIDINNSEIVCIPFPDRHIDHKIIFESCMVATRPVGKKYPKLVMCYETLSETNWNAPFIEPNFVPNVFINIDKEMDKKIKAMKIYKSQNSSTRSIDSIKSLANFRGSQNGSKYAEAYQLVRHLI